MIAIVAMFYLPITSVAVCKSKSHVLCTFTDKIQAVFTIPVFDWAKPPGEIVKPWLGLYFGVTITVGVLTFCVWWYRTRTRDSGDEQPNEPGQAGV